jgi:hypothetical protein
MLERQNFDITKKELKELFTKELLDFSVIYGLSMDGLDSLLGLLALSYAKGQLKGAQDAKEIVCKP